MRSSYPVHEIKLGNVRATIWEEYPSQGEVSEREFSVSIGRADQSLKCGCVSDASPSTSNHSDESNRGDLLSETRIVALADSTGTVRFRVEDLPLVAELMDLAHLWIHEQSVGV
ncbi:MAG: hypothetical protein ACKOCN_08560 [Planctomycetaceae bacterium]